MIYAFQSLRIHRDKSCQRIGEGHIYIVSNRAFFNWWRRGPYNNPLTIKIPWSRWRFAGIRPADRFRGLSTYRSSVLLIIVPENVAIKHHPHGLICIHTMFAVVRVYTL